LDYIFRLNWQPGKTISYFVSAGDSGLGAQYPSSSPWVVSAGGTTINRDPTTQYFVSESCWAGSGGGISTYETYSSSFGTGTGPWTNFQYPLFGQSNRRTPDISFDADPASGAWVRFNSGWYVVGGTSLSAPALAGIVNNANNRLGVAPSPGGYYTNAENNLLYAELLAINKEYKSNFYDVKTGSNGASAGTGWDYCTGVGSPRGKNGK
jgi:subtilase family serine protease